MNQLKKKRKEEEEEEEEEEKDAGGKRAEKHGRERRSELAKSRRRWRLLFPPSTHADGNH